MLERAGGLRRMRQTQMTWLTAGLFALVIGAGPALAQKKDDKVAAGADPNALPPRAIVGATNEARKGAAGTTVFTADPVTRSVVPDPSTTVAMTLAVDYLKA